MTPNKDQTKLTSKQGNEYLFFQQEDDGVKSCDMCCFKNENHDVCKTIPCANFNRIDGKDGFYKQISNN